MVVLGAGPTGEKAAAQAAYWGKRVAVVERAPDPGGAMVASAVSTKTIREAALYLTGFRRREVYGVGISLAPQLALERLHDRTRFVVRTMREAASENLHRHGIEVVQGTASLRPGRVVEVRAPDGEKRQLHTEVVLIATGSRPCNPRRSCSPPAGSATPTASAWPRRAWTPTTEAASSSTSTTARRRKGSTPRAT